MGSNPPGDLSWLVVSLPEPEGMLNSPAYSKIVEVLRDPISYSMPFCLGGFMLVDGVLKASGTALGDLLSLFWECNRLEIIGVTRAMDDDAVVVRPHLGTSNAARAVSQEPKSANPGWFCFLGLRV